MKLSISDLCKMAGLNDGLMDGTIVPMLLIMETADVVYGVFPDSTAPTGMDAIVIKGSKFIELISASDLDVPVRVAAMKMESGGMALAARRVIGDERFEKAVYFWEGLE